MWEKNGTTRCCIFSVFMLNESLLGVLSQNRQACKKILRETLVLIFATWIPLCLFICDRSSLTLGVHLFKFKHFLLTFGHFNSNLPLSLCLWSNKEISLEAKYFPLRVFKHLGSLLLFLSVSHFKFPFALCLSLSFSLPVVVCDVKIVVELSWHRTRDHGKGRER